MKRYIKTTSVIIFAVLALAGCSKTEEFQGNPDSALQIESVSGISPFALTTKAVITGDTLPNDAAATGIGIFVTANDGGAYDGHANGYTNVKFADSGSGWSTASPIYLSDTQGKIYGYFPYNSNAGDLKAVPVQSSLNGTDYLYAVSKTVSHSNKAVSLSMKHALSRLHLTIRKGANFTASAPLSKITLKSTAIDATGTLDITTGDITASKESSQTGTVELATDGEITAEGIVKDILLVPADNSEGKKDITIILTIDGKIASVTLSGDNGIDIHSGIQNNVTLTVEDSGVKIEGVGIGIWSDGGSQTLDVNGYKVTVKLAEDVAPHDILVEPYADGNIVKIDAYPKSGTSLSCVITGTATCNKTKTDNLYTFTISSITSDVTAKIGYQLAESISLDRTDVKPAKGWVFYLTATVSPFDAINKNVTWSSNRPDIATIDANGNVTAVKEGDAVITATAADGSGVTKTCTVNVQPPIEGSLSHEFSVSATKKVHFSKGNLWAERNTGTLHFESDQWGYDASPKIESNHVSHFSWASTVNSAIEGSTGDYLFCDENHKQSIDGNDDIFYDLTIQEWEYLINKNGVENKRKNKYWRGITVCGKTNCLVIAPDIWDTSANPIQASYDASSWASAQASGLVCLPAAGYFFDTYFNENAGDCGSYWSSNMSNGKVAADLQFWGSDIQFIYEDHKWTERTIRLVTNSK